MLMNVERNRASVKIVLADSDSYMRQGLRNAFATEGYQDFRTVGRLSLLRDLLASAPADLLILDVDTPDGDAVEVAREIRAGKLGKMILRFAEAGDNLVPIQICRDLHCFYGDNRALRFHPGRCRFHRWGQRGQHVKTGRGRGSRHAAGQSQPQDAHYDLFSR